MNPAAHEFLSIRVLQPLYRLYRCVHPAWRPAMLAYREGLRFRNAAAGWDPERRRDWILARLRHAVRRAWATTPYYRELFARFGFDPRADFDFDDFAALPVLEREDIHRAGQALVSTAVPPAELRKDASGGSTGVPTEVWLGPEERGWGESGIEYYMRRIGLPAGARGAALWGHHLDPKAGEEAGDRLRAFVANSRWFDCFRLSPAVLAEYHARLERWQPRYILAYATALGALAAEIADRGWKPSYPSRCCVTGAEKLMPRDRELAESVFRRPVHERYGSRDVGLIAFQIDVERGLAFEVDWPNLLVEPETAGPSAAILVTKLHADGMPMLRYRVGDLARFPRGSRPGAPTFTLEEIVGRELDRIRLSDGRWVQGAEFAHMMKDYPVREYQVVQRADSSVVVRVVPGAGFGDASRMGILGTLAPNLPGLSVRVEMVDVIPRTRANKRRYVASEIDLDRRPAAG